MSRKKHRTFSIKRDESGMPVQLTWTGDVPAVKRWPFKVGDKVRLPDGSVWDVAGASVKDGEDAYFLLRKGVTALWPVECLREQAEAIGKGAA